MTENEIREAIETLITFTKEYLSMKGWPEEQEVAYKKDADDYESQGFNKTLRLCKLASLKNYNDMRMFQERFINADQELRALKKKYGEEA